MAGTPTPSSAANLARDFPSERDGLAKFFALLSTFRDAIKAMTADDFFFLSSPSLKDPDLVDKAPAGHHTLEAVMLAP